jgi:hypothetical protein
VANRKNLQSEKFSSFQSFFTRWVIENTYKTIFSFKFLLRCQHLILFPLFAVGINNISGSAWWQNLPPGVVDTCGPGAP